MIASLGLGAAKDRPITGGNLPNMAETIKGWFVPIQIGQTTTDVEDNEAKETITRIDTMGVIQPFGPQQLKIKPEGQWSWRWYMLHTLLNVRADVGEYFYIRDTKYRVMAVTRYNRYGYYEYELVEAYSGG